MLDAQGIKPNARDRPRKGAPQTIEKLVGAAAGVFQSGQPVTVIPFDGEDKVTREYAGEVFGSVCSELRDDNHRQLWGLSPMPLRTGATDADIVARGQKMNSRFVLVGRAGVEAPGLPPTFTVRLLGTRTGEMVWKETYELSKHDGDEVGEKISAEITKRLAEAPVPPPPPVPTPEK
jgi:hypothetical protein